MFELDLDYQGLWAGLTDKPFREKTVISLARRCLRQTMVEFGQRTGRESLEFRFTDKAWGALNLTPRSAKYQKRQKSVLGRVRPFFSPRRRVAHMQTIMRIPGPGHRVSLRNFGEGSEGIIAGRMRLPGARALNAASSKKGGSGSGTGLGYAGEFLNLTRPGAPGYDAPSARWIRLRFAELMRQGIQRGLRQKSRRKKKVTAA